jgi:phosphopantothenoylcysteine decarboxylase / phosphopantothenate---cysteine ligase
MVMAVYLSAICPVIVAPAMDEDMWLHPATTKNIDTLRSFGHQIIPVAHGELASGITGAGRMAEPEEIQQHLEDFFSGKERSVHDDQVYSGLKALVTAGPTYEALDPVRFIGNFSTGKMGIAIAEALAAKGITVDLILGPSKEQVNNPLIKVTKVMSAQEMFDACIRLFPQADIAVMSAAVADYRPMEKAEEKIKKTAAETMQLTLVKNPDILAHLGSVNGNYQRVGTCT